MQARGRATTARGRRAGDAWELVETGGQTVATCRATDVRLDEFVDDEWSLSTLGPVPLPLLAAVALPLAAKVLLGRPAPVAVGRQEPDVGTGEELDLGLGLGIPLKDVT